MSASQSCSLSKKAKVAHLIMRYRSLGLIGTGRWIGTKKEQRLWTLKITEGLLILKPFYIYIIHDIVGSHSETSKLIFQVNNLLSFCPYSLSCPYSPQTGGMLQFKPGESKQRLDNDVIIKFTLVSCLC